MRAIFISLVGNPANTTGLYEAIQMRVAKEFPHMTRAFLRDPFEQFDVHERAAATVLVRRLWELMIPFIRNEVEPALRDSEIVMVPRFGFDLYHLATLFSGDSNEVFKIDREMAQEYLAKLTPLTYIFPTHSSPLRKIKMDRYFAREQGPSLPYLLPEGLNLHEQADYVIERMRKLVARNVRAAHAA